MLVVVLVGTVMGVREIDAVKVDAVEEESLESRVAVTAESPDVRRKHT